MPVKRDCSGQVVAQVGWFEFDSFLIKHEQRNRRMRAVKVLEKTGLPDLQPVMMKIKRKVKKWRRQQMRLVANIRHEKL